MRVISRKAIAEFATAHPAAKSPLGAWYKATLKARWYNFGDVRATTANSADQAGLCVIFNIGGNKYRLIARILYCRQTPKGRASEGKVYIRFIGTHKEYDEGKWKAECGVE